MYHLTHISHIPNFHYAFRNQISTLLCPFEYFYTCLGSLLGTYILSRTFETFTIRFEIKFLSLLSSLECFYTCLVSLLGLMFYLAHILHISNFLYVFWNQISTTLKSFEVLLCMFSKSFRHLCFISHASHTFQTFIMCFEIKFLPLLSPL